MQLLLLVDNNNRAFLSDMNLYNYKREKFIPRNKYIKLKNTKGKEIQLLNHIDNSDLYGTIFTRFTIISSTKFTNETVILRGTNRYSHDVFLALLLDKHKFRNFLDKEDELCLFVSDLNEICIFLNENNYLGSGLTNERSDKQLFINLKNNMTKLKPKSDKEKFCTRFSFFNEENIMVNSIIVPAELSNISTTNLATVILK
ncbi:hypothetical protein [Ehrlichia canis]|uniref:Uncharacterized protein n=1 Tax=Ehrlichia canis (strain Jake) TaxID=269484 RepID=A0ACA6AVS8_EHRCJ|nr:hypothetical protein [Ehrlichia canis]AAZ68480.1 hypothetical protein Ecaj_0438 [Ehrlichia canis str. Jake]AUO54771.1 hypothetical protein C1I72_02625 [Ehrlichia canis]UKC53581.1 hypothetical protein s20019040002_000624 [Ehrlichia canis]UKC54519.1 hypothetical protein s20026770001_000625 [Ehrlichia canis]UKC55455.1 hypothetical protein s21009500007_000625 [Ehrlichia canis]